MLAFIVYNQSVINSKEVKSIYLQLGNLSFNIV